MLRFILTFLLIFSLSACGFKLRGLIDIPVWLNNVAIITEDDNKDLVTVLKKQLSNNKITVNPDTNKASYWLVLVHTSYNQQLSSVAASTTPRQYQLIYNVDFMLKSTQGLVSIPLSHISITRQLTINNDKILGSNDEANLILEEMRKEASIQIINKLSIKLSS